MCSLTDFIELSLGRCGGLVSTATVTGQGASLVDASVRGGDFSWPKTGTFGGHQRGHQLAKTGDFLMATDKRTYQKAIMELAASHADDAITDAGTALQETLTVLGCSGNSLGPLITDARKRGLLAPHDAKLDQSISNIMVWVSADRSELGEAHHVSDATVEDAWLIVHIVGALILRLASGPPRGTSS
jgi:hypothetical protein